MNGFEIPEVHLGDVKVSIAELLGSVLILVAGFLLASMLSARVRGEALLRAMTAYPA